MGKRKRYAGKIELDTKLLLDILDLKDGEIHSIQLDDYLPHKTLTMIIEHPDMPLVKESEPLRNIYLTHQITYGDNGVPTKLERIEPPKKTGKIKSVRLNIGKYTSIS